MTQCFIVHVEFFVFLPTEFAACSKPPSTDNHRQASYPRTQQYDQGTGVLVEPRSCNQSGPEIT